MSFLSSIDEPLGEVNFEIKPWHLALGAVGVGGLVWYLMSKKSEPARQAPMLVNTAAGPRKVIGGKPVARKKDCVKVGVQTSPLFAGHPIVKKVKAFQKKGWKIFRVPTGTKNVLANRQHFDVMVVWACPPGMRPPVAPIPPMQRRPAPDYGDEAEADEAAEADSDSEPIETEAGE